MPHQVSGAAYHRKRRGFLVCTTTNRRHSTPPRERRFSSLYRNKLVVQSGHKRHIERKDQHTAAREKPRKEEEPSSTAAHSPQAHLHRTRARTHLSFVWMHALAPRKMRPLEAAGAHTGAYVWLKAPTWPSGDPGGARAAEHADLLRRRGRRQ